MKWKNLKCRAPFATRFRKGMNGWYLKMGYHIARIIRPRKQRSWLRKLARNYY